MGGMHEKGNSDSPYSSMDQADFFSAGMHGMPFVCVCGRADLERVCGKGRGEAGLYHRAGGADESKRAEPRAADATGYGI